MSRLLNSLSFRIGISIIIIEILIMGVVGLIYYDRFSDEVDRRLTEQMQTAGQLFGSTELALTSLLDQDVMSILVGGNVLDSMMISEDGNIRISLNADYRNQTIEAIPDIDETWLSDATSSRVELSPLDENTLLGFFPVQDGNLFIFLRTDIGNASQEKQELLLVILAGSLATIIATSLAILFNFNYSILSRIHETVLVLGQLEAGNLAARIDNSGSSDEIGVLQQQVNSMASRREQSENAVNQLNKQLSQFNQDLERRVHERTRDLNIAAEVSQQVTRVLEMTQLLPRLCDVTKEGFDLEHVSVFVYDKQTNILRLDAGSGLIGKKMLEAGKQFQLDDKGLVPLTARTSEVQLIADVTKSPDHFVNPLLPNTRSEITLPMYIGTDLIGVLDLQSDDVDFFTDDNINVLTALAEQIAVAIHNANLYEEAQDAKVEAEQANTVKSAFLASMSHELRTPLNAIINFSKYLKKGIAGPINGEQEELIGSIAESGTLLLNLINDVLDMSKIEAGSLKLYLEDNIQLDDVIQNALGYTAPLIEGKDVKIVTELPEKLPVLRADKKRLLQILLNVLSNACKFTDEGSITVAVSEKDTSVLVSVKDTGAGIAEEDIDYVFTAFKQTNTGLRQGGGTGLGMPICQKLAEAHGGHIWFESVLDEGTTFYIELPLNGERIGNNV